MRRLDRYIFRETLTPGILALVALTFVVSSRQVGFLVDIVVRQNPSFSDIWAVVAALLPTIVSVTLPMALLVGILTGFGRMSSDSEAIALRAAGISVWRIFRPILLLALLSWAATASLTIWIAPQNTANLRALRGQLARKYPVTLDLQPRVFFERPNWNFLLYVNEFPPGDAGIRMRGIMFVDTKKPDLPEVTFAESGSIIPFESERRLQLTLSNSSTHIVSAEQPDRYEIASSRQNTFSVPLPAEDDETAPPVEELPTRELWERIRNGTASRPEYVQFHQRLALPFACFAFALLGLPLGITTNRGGRSLGLVLSLLLMFVYYLAFAGGTGATRTETFPPVLGAWLPNVVFSVLGLLLMMRADRQHENRLLRFLAQGLESVARLLTAFKLGGLSLSRWAYAVSTRFRLFRLLDVYVLRGFWFFFVIVLGVFSALFIVVTLFERLPDIIKNDIAATTVVTYIFFLLPQIIYWVSPLAVLLAVLINLGTLTKTNEVLAVKAGAISLYRMALPLVLMAGLLSASIYAMQEYVLPTTNRIQDQYQDFIRKKAPQTYRDPHRKWMKGSTSNWYHYIFFDPSANAFADISIFNVNPGTFQLQEWIFAKRAMWNGTSWNFEEGRVRRISEQHVVQEEKFDLRVVSDIDPPAYFKKEVREADQMNYTELEQYVADLQRSGIDVSGLMVALYRKLSFPLVSLIMALIGIPFSFKTGRRGAFYGVGLCLAVGIVYWLTFQLFERLGGINQLSPAVAAWFPNLIFGASGLWLMLRVKT
jgi:LPS export ABC transporter permease LptG/LPS export ABC transporter permease LptF